MSNNIDCNFRKSFREKRQSDLYKIPECLSKLKNSVMVSKTASCNSLFNIFNTVQGAINFFSSYPESQIKTILIDGGTYDEDVVSSLINIRIQGLGEANITSFYQINDSDDLSRNSFDNLIVGNFSIASKTSNRTSILNSRIENLTNTIDSIEINIEDCFDSVSPINLTTFSTKIKNFTHAQPNTSTPNESNHLLSSICNFISDDSSVTHTFAQGRLKNVSQNNGTFNGRGCTVNNGTFTFTGNASSNQEITNFQNTVINLNTTNRRHNLSNCTTTFDSSNSGVSFLNIGGSLNNTNISNHTHTGSSNSLAIMDATSNTTNLSNSTINSNTTNVHITSNASGSSFNATNNNLNSGTGSAIVADSPSITTVSNNNITSISTPSLVQSNVGPSATVATGNNNVTSNPITTTASGGATQANLQSR